MQATHERGPERAILGAAHVQAQHLQPPSAVTPIVITTAPTTTQAVDAGRSHGDSAHAVVFGRQAY
jgi:hypothetical protein